MIRINYELIRNGTRGATDMKTLLTSIILLILMFSPVALFGANFNKKDIPISTDTINFLLPADVLLDFNKASDKEKSKFCRASNTSIELISLYAEGLKEIPKQIWGYNSRMDNTKDVPYAEETGLFILRVSEVITDAWAFNDSGKKEIVLEALNQWASNDALLETKPCAHNGRLDRGCTAWTQSDGQDLSDSKDYDTVQMWVMKLAYGYFFALADYEPEDQRHKTIQKWFGKFFDRNKRPREVYFGLDHGWFYPTILERLIKSRSPNNLIKQLLKGLDQQVFDDGSMKNRTTRGNRALWYHHDAVKEAMVTIEIARRANVDIPKSLSKRLTRAGEVFINGYFDHASLDRWAKEAHNAVYEPGKQDFRKKLNRMPNGHSWFYIFSYWYPLSALTPKLDEIILQDRNQAVKDGQIGFGLGCIYAVAKLGRR